MALMPMTPAARRTRWLSLAALPFAVAAALAASGWETALEWWQVNDREERRVERGAAAAYAGAEWRLGAVTKLAERPDGSALVIAEFEATVRDLGAVAQPPCQVRLTDGNGRSWAPAFLASREVRQSSAADKPSCGSAMLGQPKAGDRLVMVESFVLPAASVGDARLTISLPAGRPEYLRFE